MGGQLSSTSPVNGATNDGDARLEAAVSRSGRRWRRLAMHARAVAPSDIAHFLLVLLAFGAVGWLVWHTWFALLPFQLGLVLAYISLPAVDALDRFMPRVVASVLVITAGIIAVLAFVGAFVPAIVREVPYVIAGLPDQVQIQAFFATLADRTRTLPEPVQVFLQNWLRQVVTNVQTNFGPYVRVLLQNLLTGVFSLVNTVSFLLGFLVLPTWMLAVMSNHQNAVAALRRGLPKWMQPDLWAVARIIDRSFGIFLRGQFLRAIVTTCLTWVGLAVLELLGFPTMKYKLLLALWNGVFVLVPVIGGLIGALPLFLAGLFRSPQMAVAMIGVVVVVQQLENRLVTSRLERRLIDIHPAILVPVLVAVSQFGLLWIFIASPLLVVIRDLYRYVYGRVSDPPLPAGVLPPARAPYLVEGGSRRAPSAPRMARPTARPGMATASRMEGETLPGGRGGQ